MRKDSRFCYLNGRNQTEMRAFLAYVDREGIDRSHWEDIEDHFYAGFRAASRFARKQAAQD